MVISKQDTHSDLSSFQPSQSGRKLNSCQWSRGKRKELITRAWGWATDVSVWRLRQEIENIISAGNSVFQGLELSAQVPQLYPHPPGEGGCCASLHASADTLFAQVPSSQYLSPTKGGFPGCPHGPNCPLPIPCPATHTHTCPLCSLPWLGSQNTQRHDAREEYRTGVWRPQSLALLPSWCMTPRRLGSAPDLSFLICW